MNKLPPHKRHHATLYRAWFWRLKGLEYVVDKTQVEKHEIIAALEQLDKLWNAMPIDQKRDIDPLWEMPEDMRGGGTWEELKVLRCPNCGYLLHLSASSDGPPKCVSCMRDVVVNIRVDAGETMDKSTP